MTADEIAGRIVDAQWMDTFAKSDLRRAIRTVVEAERTATADLVAEARKQALEEAAQIADARYRVHNGGIPDEWDSGASRAAEFIAEEIRALAGQPAQPAPAQATALQVLRREAAQARADAANATDPMDKRDFSTAAMVLENVAAIIATQPPPKD